MKIFLDTETIPNQTGIARDYISRTIKPPGTIKLAASIEKWHTESKATAIDDAVAGTGLDGAFGQVVCVGMASNDDSSVAICGLDEAAVLNRVNVLFDGIPKVYKGRNGIDPFEFDAIWVESSPQRDPAKLIYSSTHQVAYYSLML